MKNLRLKAVSLLSLTLLTAVTTVTVQAASQKGEADKQMYIDGKLTRATIAVRVRQLYTGANVKVMLANDMKSATARFAWDGELVSIEINKQAPGLYNQRIELKSGKYILNRVEQCQRWSMYYANSTSVAGVACL